MVPEFKKKKALFLGYDKSETILIDFLVSKKFHVFHSSKKTADFFSARANFDFNDFDLIISYGYRHIIPKSLINRSPIIFNLHIGLLPYNKGSHPVFWSAYEGTPSGVSIHIIDEGIDTGPLLYQKAIDIDCKKNTFTEAHKSLKHEVEKLFIHHFDEILSEDYSPEAYLDDGTYHNSWELPKEFSGWDENILLEIKRLKNNLYFREAISKDCDEIFEWRNNETTRNMSVSSNIIQYGEHVKWFESILSNSSEICLFFVDQLVNLKLGIVRFQLNELMENALISINLSPDSRGKNYAKPCLENAISYLKTNFINCNTLYAEIKKDNFPSIKTFEGLNFQLLEEKKVRNDFLTYKLSI